MEERVEGREEKEEMMSTLMFKNQLDRIKFYEKKMTKDKIEEILTLQKREQREKKNDFIEILGGGSCADPHNPDLTGGE